MEHPRPAPDGPDWALVLGPGAELERAVPLLEALAETTLAAPLEVEGLEDLAELGEERLAHGRLVLHADVLPLEDLGLVRRFLEAEPGWELVLVGLDPSATVARRLLRRPGVRWFAEPLDLDQLGDLVAPPASREAWGVEDDEDALPPLEGPAAGDPLAAALGVALEEEELAAFREPDDFDRYDEPEGPEEPRTVPAPVASAPTPQGFDEEIERILSEPPRPGSEAAPRGARTDPHRPLASESTPAATALLAHGRGSAEGADEATDSGSVAPAPFFKDQVADLADIALRIELSLEMARERALAEGDGPALEDLEAEVQRLAQFTRTLSYLSSPPAPGRTRVGLADMLEEMLAEAGADEHSPRYLWRAEGELAVRCDKTLLHQSLEAVLYLVHHCAGPAGTVRVEGRERSSDEGRDATVELTLRFPPGRLEGLAPEEAVVPYALRSVLPDLGPNALAAAAGILRGQGGRLELSSAGGEWLWRLRMPAA